MTIKEQYNSLRCRQWRGFVKQKLALLKEADIPGKAYVINGYKIILKALINLAIIKAPPGLVIFRKAPHEIQLYYADMYGYGKEKPVAVQSLRDTAGEPPINPMDDGWPGNILTLPLGNDFVQLFFGARPDTSVDSPSYFTTRSGFGLRSLAVAPYAFRVTKGFLNTVEDVTLPHVTSLVNVGDWYVFAMYGECRNFDYGFPALYFGSGKIKPNGTFNLEFPYEIPEDWFGETWQRSYCQYMYVWKHYSAYSGRDVARVMAIIQGVNTGFNADGCYFLFMEIDPVGETIYYWGYTNSEDMELLSEDIPVTIDGDILGYWWIGAPETQATEVHGYKNVIFPMPDGELAIINFDNTRNTIATAIPLIVNDYNNPYLQSGLNIPYIYDEFVNPFCVRVDETLPALYMYWEEAMRFGGEDTDIIRLKYGSPFASWIDFPFFDEGVRMTNFTPIKITWDHRIILATIYKELDPQEGGGMYTALLDTEKSSDWIIGQRFSETRLDRCSPTVFGEHPYVEERKKYGGTQWGWDYSYCRNYEEPPGGYPT
jgi:hypothetical protein